MGQVHALPNAQELSCKELGLKLFESRSVDSCDGLEVKLALF